MSSDDKPDLTNTEAQAESDDREKTELVIDEEPELDAAVEIQSDPGFSDDSTSDEASDKPANSADSPASAAPAKGGALRVFVWLLLFILIGLLGAGGFYWQKNVYQADLQTLREQLNAVNGAQSEVGTALKASLDAVNAVAAAAAAEASSLGAKIDGTKKAQSDLQRSVTALYEKETQTSVDWVLAEAEYLILAATQRLALERDVQTALAALRAADQRLRSAEHPDLIPIREQILQDVTALEAVNLPDIEGLAIYLAKSIGQVDELPTKPIAEEVRPFSSVRASEYKAEDWRRLGYAIWTDLVELVEVKDADLPDSVLFDPELRYFLRQNLKLELASARLAVLRRDRANLEASVTLINRLFEAYYDTSDASVANISSRLSEAQKLELTPTLPSITSSLDVIRKYRLARPATTGSTP
jgi:uroporphyrin-3 C-methyltransferase